MTTPRLFQHPRRVWITATATIALIALSAPTALAGSSRASVAPKQGGSIVIRQTNPPDCLDSYKTALAQTSQVDGNVHLGLLSLNQKLKPSPGIARTWKISNGGKTVTFFLRHDVKFSDGKTVTAADVKASFDHAFDPATKSPASKGFLSQITSVTTPDRYTVRLQLSSPSRVLFNSLASNYAGILEKSQLQTLGQDTCGGNLVGAGPFKVANAAPAFASVELRQNPDYFNFNRSWAHNKGKPYLSKLTYSTIVNDATATSELLSGQIDITPVTGPELSRVQGNKNVVLHKSLAQAMYVILFNTAHAPFDNINVRRAVAQAIVRSDLVKAAFNGLAKPAYGIVASTLPYSDPKAKTYAVKLDPAAAQRAIAAAGAKGPYTMLAYNTPTVTTMGEIIQQELSQAGMQVNITPKAPGDAIGAAIKGNFDLALVEYIYTDPDILYFLFNSSQGGGKGLAVTNYVTPTLDSLTQQGRETLDPKKAKTIYFKAQKLLAQSLPAVPLAVPETVTAVRSRVKGWHTDIAGNVLIQDLYVGK